MRKTSRMWKAPARGLPRALTARLLAVVLSVVMAVVWLVSEISGVGLTVTGVSGGKQKSKKQCY